MHIAQAQRHIGDWVRYRLGGPVPHMARARIMGVRDGKVLIQPPRHKKAELIDAGALRLWKARNATMPRR